MGRADVNRRFFAALNVVQHIRDVLFFIEALQMLDNPHAFLVVFLLVAHIGGVEGEGIKLQFGGGWLYRFHGHSRGRFATAILPLPPLTVRLPLEPRFVRLVFVIEIIFIHDGLLFLVCTCGWSCQALSLAACQSKGLGLIVHGCLSHLQLVGLRASQML